MSKLQELISELCPNGVPFRPVWEVTIWDKKFNGVDRHKQPKIISYPYLLAKDMKALEQERGDVTLLSTGEYIGYTTQELAGEFLCEGEVVTLPWGGTVKGMKYFKGKFVTADNRIATSSDTAILNNKFLYYIFLQQADLIQTFYRGAGIQHPNMSHVLNMLIPLPPLPVQEEIVRVLDLFTGYGATLQDEHQARKEQYEYYRNLLLTFPNPDSPNPLAQENPILAKHNCPIQWKTMGDIGGIKMCKRVMKHETSATGDIPFYKIGTFGKVADAFISDTLYREYKNKYPFPRKGTILISAAGTIGRCVVYNGEDAYFQDSNIVWLDNDESQVLNTFLYHYYQIVDWETAGGTLNAFIMIDF